jgi:c-di-GMP-binding flagellar brake protein YcgR
MNNSISSSRQLLHKWDIDHFVISTQPCGVGLKDMATYQVRSQREIASLLQQVLANEEKIVMTAATHPSGVSALIREIDVEQEAMTVTLTEIADSTAFCAQPMLHETVLDGVRIFFYAALIPGEFRARPAFKISIPKMLIRVQRRLHYRVPTRSGAFIRCEIPVGDTLVHAQVINLSGGGICVSDELGLLPLDVGGIHPNCTIHFEGNPLELSLELRNIRKIGAAEESTRTLLGYRFFEPVQRDLDVIQHQVNRLEQRKIPSRFR